MEESSAKIARGGNINEIRQETLDRIRNPISTGEALSGSRPRNVPKSNQPPRITPIEAKAIKQSEQELAKSIKQQGIVEQEYGMPEAGLQKGMFGEEKIIRPEARGTLTQGSMLPETETIIAKEKVKPLPGQVTYSPRVWG